MTPLNKHSVDDTLLVKFLQNEVLDEERQQVINWLDENGANSAHYNKLRKVWLLAQGVKSVDTKRAWNNVEQRTNSRSLFIAISSVAASILLLLGVFSWWSNSEPDSLVFANNEMVVRQERLPDSTSIVMNAGAQISYLKNDKEQRRIEQKGKVYYEVKRDEKRPFIIDVGIGEVRVLGTSFNVNIAENEDVIVDVRSGVVELSFVTSNNDTLQLFLVEGKSGVISKEQDKIIALSQSPTTFFKLKRQLIFFNTPVKDVFNMLEDSYEVKITGIKHELLNKHFTSVFIDEPIEAILEVIGASFDVSFSKKDGSYILVKTDTISN